MPDLFTIDPKPNGPLHVTGAIRLSTFRLRKMRRHGWAANLTAPHMALCYVGVHENVPFPAGIENELRAYLAEPRDKGP